MIIFSNPGHLDLRLLELFGASAKDGANPIGQFGTGLKYSIAVALRNNFKLEIFSGLQHITFSTDKISIRDKDFQRVLYSIDDAEPKPIGFTLDLGKNWEPWMILRELHSNALDEGGSSQFLSDNWTQVMMEEGKTKIILKGADHLWKEMPSIFLQGDADYISGNGVEIFRRPSEWIYCKRVRVQKRSTMELTYNLSDAELTEDRTVKDSYYFTSRLMQTLLNSNEIGLIDIALRGRQGETTFYMVTPASGTRAYDLMMQWGAKNQLNARYQEFYEEHISSLPPQVIPWDEINFRRLKRAQGFLELAGIQTDKYPIHLAKSVPGGSRLGCADTVDQKIYLSSNLMDQGLKQIAACLLEEILHLDTGMADLTYQFQNHIFNLLIGEMEKRLGEDL